jgi:hypothetical protein
MIQAVRLRLKGPLCVPACCQRKRIDWEQTFSVSEMGQKPSAGHVRFRPSLARSRHSALGHFAPKSAVGRLGPCGHRPPRFHRNARCRNQALVGALTAAPARSHVAAQKHSPG